MVLKIPKLQNQFISIAYGILIFISFLSLQIGFGLTTSRLVVVIFPLLFIYQINVSSRNFTVPLQSLIPLFITIQLFVFSSISFLFFSGELWPVISWIFLGFMSCFVTIAIYNTSHAKQILLQKVIILLCLLFVMEEIFNLKEMGLIGIGGTSIRRYYGQDLGIDINRLMNTMFVISSLSIGYLYLNYFKGVIWKLILTTSFLLPLFLIVSTGSRQNIIAIVLFIVLIFLITRKRFGGFFKSILKNSYRLIILAVVILVGYFISVTYGYLDINYFNTRFVENIIRQENTTGDEERLDSANRAISYMYYNNGFGIGADNFPPPEVHNGYLLFLAENGVIAGGLALFITIIGIGYILIKIKFDVPTVVVYFSLFIIIALWLTNLKVLFREPIYWAVLGIVNGLSIQKKSKISNPKFVYLQ